jgi:hypothetical protein
MDSSLLNLELIARAGALTVANGIEILRQVESSNAEG